MGLGFKAQQIGAGGKGLDVEGEGFAFGDVGLTTEDAGTGDIVEGNRGVGGREVATDVDGAVGRVGIYAEAALYGDGVDARVLLTSTGRMLVAVAPEGSVAVTVTSHLPSATP